MWRLTTLALLLVAAATHVAHAQGATDNELYAGYCAGVLSGENNTPDVQQMKQRFMSYPWMTGAMTAPGRRDAVLGIGAAQARGVAEGRQCSATIGGCNATVDDAIRRQARTRAPQLSHDLQLKACVNRDLSCTRSLRCFGPDALPF